MARKHAPSIGRRIVTLDFFSTDRSQARVCSISGIGSQRELSQARKHVVARGAKVNNAKKVTLAPHRRLGRIGQFESGLPSRKEMWNRQMSKLPAEFA
jgi:hypothetical protein